MKAAVLHRFGKTPRYEDFADPSPGPDDTVIQVKAVALEQIDRAIARGSHFASRQFVPTFPAIVGTKGIGMLDDGRLVGFGGVPPPYGAMAERAVIPRAYAVAIPAGIDALVAGAVPSSAVTALLSLKWGAHLQAGETVLINGATGFAGKLAIQIAKLLGAGRVVGTGRHVHSLQTLHALGADSVIDLARSDQHITQAIQQEAGSAGYAVVLDFLWGYPTELLLQTLVPQHLAFARQHVRLVQIGAMAGPTIALAAEAMRTSGLTIAGAGGGLTPEALAEGTQLVWEWLTTGKLAADLEPMPLREVERAWKRTDLHGKRIVLVP